MAIQCDYIFKGILIPDAFIEITDVKMSKIKGSEPSKLKVSFVFEIYVDQELSKDAKNLIDKKSIKGLELVESEISSSSLQAYLKTQPDFADAVDI